MAKKLKDLKKKNLLRKRVLNGFLYSYVEKSNEKHAKTVGKKLFGSHSAYVNALIAKDRGVKPKLGFWKSKGEARLTYLRNLK